MFLPLINKARRVVSFPAMNNSMLCKNVSHQRDNKKKKIAIVRNHAHRDMLVWEKNQRWPSVLKQIYCYHPEVIHFPITACPRVFYSLLIPQLFGDSFQLWRKRPYIHVYFFFFHIPVNELLLQKPNLHYIQSCCSSGLKNSAGL